MGSNNRYYKMKDKKLTKNKKNAKLNKSIAFALASIATVGASSILVSTGDDAKAMMGRTPAKTFNTMKSSKTLLKPGVNPNTSLTTQRMLRGAPGAINSGRIGPNGTQYQGMKTSKPNTAVSHNQVTTNTTLNTSASGVSLKPTNTKPPVPPKPSRTSILTHKFNQDKKPITLKNDKLTENTYSQTNNTDDKIYTTQGFYRK